MKSTIEEIRVLKRVIFLVLTFAVMYMILPQSVAKAARSGDYEYTVSGTNATITKYYGSEENLIIPNKLNGYTVTSLDSGQMDVSIISNTLVPITITIPDTVTNIGISSFDRCMSLETVTLSKNITSINDLTFQYCKNLKEIVIPNGVTSIKGYAFSGCGSLKSITLPNSVTEIGCNAFGSCRSLEKVTLPSNLTKIYTAAFLNCTNLKDVILQNKLTIIYPDVFNNCTSLTQITIPESVINIQNNAFVNCTNLESMTFKSTAPPSFGTNVFKNSNKLSTINVPDGSVDAYKKELQLAPYTVRGPAYTTLIYEREKFISQTVPYVSQSFIPRTSDLHLTFLPTGSESPHTVTYYLQRLVNGSWKTELNDTLLHRQSVSRSLDVISGATYRVRAITTDIYSGYVTCEVLQFNW